MNTMDYLFIAFAFLYAIDDIKGEANETTTLIARFLSILLLIQISIDCYNLYEYFIG